MAGARPGAKVLNMAPPTEEELAAVGAQARVERRPPPPGKANFKGGAAQRTDFKPQDQGNGAGADEADDVSAALKSEKQTVWQYLCPSQYS
jgi:hypothetical protein